MNQSTQRNPAMKKLARQLFHQKVLQHFRGAMAPGEAFINTCMDEGMTVGEVASLWSNRLR